MIGRRGFLIGLGAALSAPAIVRAESLMHIAVLRDSITAAEVEANTSIWLVQFGEHIERAYLAQAVRMLGQRNAILDALE
jgi:hypothetical protein